MKGIVLRIGVVIIAIGGVVAIIGSIGCANAGFTGANVFEFIKCISISVLGGLLCWLGGEIISLKQGVR